MKQVLEYWTAHVRELVGPDQKIEHLPGSDSECPQGNVHNSSDDSLPVLFTGPPQTGVRLIALFSSAWESLRADGRLFVLRPSDFSGDETAEAAENRMWQLAARCGMEHAATHRSGDAGAGAYCLDEYHRRSALRWRVAAASTRQLVELRRLFKVAFGHEVSERLWDWKYGQGRGCGSVVWRGDQLVAHYGIISRPIQFKGRESRAWLVGDVMVEPGDRGALTKRGPFFLAAASCSDACLAFDPQHLIGVGFPNVRVMRLAEKLDIYRSVGSIRELSWQPTAVSLPRGIRAVRIADDADAAVGKSVQRLWQRMAADLPDAVLVRRDWDYVRQRYLQHPEIDYRVYMVKRLPVFEQGVIVLRMQGAAWELMDVIAPMRHFPLLLRQAIHLLKKSGGQRLSAWVTAAYADRFCSGDCLDQDPGVAVPTSFWAPGPAVESLMDRWWLTYGDTDFH